MQGQVAWCITRPCQPDGPIAEAKRVLYTDRSFRAVGTVCRVQSMLQVVGKGELSEAEELVVKRGLIISLDRLHR
jgi:hypothetical protein